MTFVSIETRRLSSVAVAVVVHEKAEAAASCFAAFSEVGVELLLDGRLREVGPVQQLDLARQLHEQLSL
jgi:hypothetical protein